MRTSTQAGALGAGAWNFEIGTQEADVLVGSGLRDLFLGRGGDDRLIAGAGNDILIGGRGGDSYEISTTDGGTDLIWDRGSAPSGTGYYATGEDRVVLDGFASTDAALHGIGFQINGDDLILTYDNAGTTGQIVMRDFYAGNGFFIEELDIGTGAPEYHFAYLSGDNHTYSVHSGPDQGGEDIVLGTNGSEEIYSGIGNDIILGGGGADAFMFHDEEDANGSHDIILDFNTANDFLDFTDIAGMDYSDVSVADNGYGNAVVTTVYGTIELIGVTAIEVTEDIFAFA